MKRDRSSAAPRGTAHSLSALEDLGIHQRLVGRTPEQAATQEPATQQAVSSQPVSAPGPRRPVGAPADAR